MTDDDLTTRTVSVVVKAVAVGDEWTLEILGVPFGGPKAGRDSDGERFVPETAIHQDKYPRVPLVLAHGLDPRTGKPAGKPVYIGAAEYLRTDAAGHWFKGILDKTKEIVRGLWEAAKDGKLFASSGSIAHLVRKAKDGTILEWPVAEMTLVDVGSTNMRPANGYAVALPMIKATYREAGLQFPDDADNSDDGAKPGAAKAAAQRARVAAIKAEAKRHIIKAAKLLGD